MEKIKEIIEEIAILGFLIGVCILGLLIILLIFIHFKGYFQALPVKGWYEQAYSAADAEQMYEWLDKLIKEMEKRGMTQGHYAIIFKNPHNDIALDLEVFKSLKDRCKEIEKYPKGSMHYAESLEDIRRQMDKTDFNPYYWVLVNKYKLRIIAFILILDVILIFVCFIIILLLEKSFND